MRFHAAGSVMCAALLLALVGCRPDWLPTDIPGAPGTFSGSDIAGLLAHPPQPGVSVEVDAYYCATGPYIRTVPPPPEDVGRCPALWYSALTDRPFQPMLYLLNGSSSNALPPEAPYLLAVSPEQAQPGNMALPQLPYHARLRGHLGEPAFAHCDQAERIFVVEEVVTVYEQLPPHQEWGLQLPADYGQWRRHYEPALGYSLPVPSGWGVESGGADALLLRSPDWPDYPVTVRVHDAALQYDPYEPGNTPALMQGQGWALYQQGMAFNNGPSTQGLHGYHILRDSSATGKEVAVLFGAHGRTYELALRYPSGFDSPQPLLTAYSAIVEGFALDILPEPSPTPPVRQTLGSGPFLSQEEALALVRERGDATAQLLRADLVSEAAARALQGPCSSFTGHAEGVWLLVVRGHYEDQERTMRFYLDALSGAQLCGEEIVD